MASPAPPRSPVPASIGRGIPVGLNEAALDSPSFRATANHFADQVEAVERWLVGYVNSSSKFAHDIQGLEDTINSYLTKTMPSAADGIIENDYTFLALKRVGDAQRECWMQIISSVKRMDSTVIDPVRNFLSGDMRNFREIRRILEQTQRSYDSTLARYVGQSKTKEPSALREDAFSVYENRKAYFQASLDYCQLAPQLRLATDKLLIKVCTEMWKDLLRSRDAVTNATRWTREMDRVRGWAKEMEASEGVFRKELQAARKHLGETTLDGFKPSRELEDYGASTVPFLGSRGPLNLGEPKDSTAVISEKQAWLFLRIISGKPVRYTWTRRWYYCRDGVFGWLVPGPQGVLQGDEIGVLLCNVKPAVGEDRRFCFEVKTKNQTMLLQAENQKELIEWLEVFDVTKKKAFETTMGNDKNASAGGTDPAFSISPPSAPEFSAMAAESSAADDHGQGVDRSATLNVPGQDSHTAGRHSVEVSNASLGRRSFTTLGRDLAREDDESRREQYARIIKTLDLHRKGSSGVVEPGPTSPGLPPSSGIASLISASHNLLPVGAPISSNAPRQQQGLMPSLDVPPGSLAPLTLAKPPASTSLSRAALLLTAEKRTVSTSGKLPTSVVANYWGSNIWATTITPEQPVLPRRDDDDPIGIIVHSSSQTNLSGLGGEGQADRPFPISYPTELRAQNAQFRLLFPNAPQRERLVLVFRAAWSSSTSRSSTDEALSGEGRIYVTPDNMYFYSQQMGLVTAHSISLDLIAEVTAAAGKDCDYIFLNLVQDATDVNDAGYACITIRVFLDDLQLLHTRLNLLVDNLQAEEPMDTQDIIAALVNIEKDEFERPSPSPIAEGWGEEHAYTPIEEGEGVKRSTIAGNRHDYGDQHRQQHGSHIQPSRPHQRLPVKLHLPSHPVIYEPEGMTQMAAERHFEISAKACFHVLFGDKSFVFPKLYFEHRAQQIAQGPWALVDEGQMRRDFQFQVDYVDLLGRKKCANVADYQTIDVYSDHVTYVVSHIKTMWHLPHSGSFKSVTKIVITHVAKSKCKLAAYIKIDWSKTPALSKNLIERQALHDAINDAEEMAELATDQVRKLGPRSRTNRAIQVYGHVGQQTQVVVFSPAAAESGKKQDHIKPRTLTAMMFETARSFTESAITSLIMWAFAGLRKVFDIISAHRLIIIVLGASVLTNVLLMSTESSRWWKERGAANFMRRVGITPNPTMSRAIYFADLDEATGAGGHDLNWPKNSTCVTTYKTLLDATEMDIPWEEAGATLSSASSRATARRLRRTRQRLGSYRHDLMVAMRVVNSIEREMVQSEWENWLINEKSLCDELDMMLQAEDSDKATKDTSSAERVMATLSGDRKRALEEWRDGYCGSCRHDFETVIKERMVAGA